MRYLENAKRVLQKLTDAGHTAYFTGGWVRDFLMQCASDDIDIATSASVEEIQALFPKTIPVGIHFGIVIVIENDSHFEVATFRIDVDYVDGRRPSGIKKATPEEDAQRRDFTINGLFYDPLKNEVIDYVNGKEDIEKRIIRAIGNPHDRFKEDRLRMIRAVRYATRFSFTIEEKTLEAIRYHANEIVPAVSIERIWQEFKKMSRFAHFDKALVLLYDLTLLQRIFPKLESLTPEEFQKRIDHLAKFPKDTPTILSMLQLFEGISEDELSDFCEMLKVSGVEKELAESYLHVQRITSMPQDWQEGLEKAEWAEIYAKPYTSLSLTLMGCKVADSKAFEKEHQLRQLSMQEGISRLQEKSPVLRAHDLLKLGIKPGVLMGSLLKESIRLSINEDLFDKDALLSRLRSLPIWP